MSGCAYRDEISTFLTVSSRFTSASRQGPSQDGAAWCFRNGLEIAVPRSLPASCCWCRGRNRIRRCALPRAASSAQWSCLALSGLIGCGCCDAARFQAVLSLLPGVALEILLDRATQDLERVDPVYTRSSKPRPRVTTPVLALEGLCWSHLLLLPLEACEEV